MRGKPHAIHGANEGKYTGRNWNYSQPLYCRLSFLNGAEFFVEWEGSEEWVIGMLLRIVGKLNEMIIEALKRFLVRMWN